MRQLTTLPDADEARRFADYLLTLKIQTRLEPEREGWAVWVCDEDRLAQARQELEAFTRNPSDPRFAGASRQAESLRRQEARADQAYARRQVDLHERWGNRPDLGRPVTFALMAISILVAVASRLGEERASPVIQRLTITRFGVEGSINWWSRYDRLSEVRQGEVWRLVTPIFIHFGPIHLLFNMMMLYPLGGAIEMRRGSLRFLLLVLVLAVTSNLAQYFLGHPEFSRETGLTFQHNPVFGGMSGVLYGLFGYIWMKSRYEPALGLYISRNTVTSLMVWYFLCLAGVFGSIANMAHTAGLVVGILIGYAPHLLRLLFRPEP
jgi:GlpG protein